MYGKGIYYRKINEMYFSGKIYCFVPSRVFEREEFLLEGLIYPSELLFIRNF
jgi:hypothetical protein